MVGKVLSLMLPSFDSRLCELGQYFLLIFLFCRWEETGGDWVLQVTYLVSSTAKTQTRSVHVVLLGYLNWSPGLPYDSWFDQGPGFKRISCSVFSTFCFNVFYISFSLTTCLLDISFFSFIPISLTPTPTFWVSLIYFPRKSSV